MTSEQLNLILAITSIITTIIVLITLIVIAQQIRQNTIISYYQYYKDVDIALLQNEEAAQSVLGESKEDAMAYLAFLTLSLTFQLRKEHLTNKTWWKSDEATVMEVLKQERMRLHWKQFQHVYNPEFARYIDRKLEELGNEHKKSMSVNSQSSN